VAAGTGALAAALAAEARGPLDLTLADRSEAMLARAARRLGGRARLRRADALALPWAAGSFDLVTIGYLLHLLPPEDATRALHEAARVLAPGGRLVTATHVAARGRLSAALQRLPYRASGLDAPPLRDVRPLHDAAGLAVRAERRVALGYPTQVILSVPGGRAPGAPQRRW
jgi:ubiquinone/menaquinone biosynthesis C-methylase UbiE